MNDNQKNSLWIHCPICGGKTRTKVYDDTVLVKFPLYCPKCKKEIKIDVTQLKMVLSKWTRHIKCRASFSFFRRDLLLFGISTALLSVVYIRKQALIFCTAGILCYDHCTVLILRFLCTELLVFFSNLIIHTTVNNFLSRQKKTQDTFLWLTPSSTLIL